MRDACLRWITTACGSSRCVEAEASFSRRSARGLQRASDIILLEVRSSVRETEVWWFHRTFVRQYCATVYLKIRCSMPGHPAARV